MTISSFVSRIRVVDEFMPTIINAVAGEWAKRNQIQLADKAQRTHAISALKTQIKLAAEKIKFLDPGTIKYIENEIHSLEIEILRLESENETASDLLQTEQFIRISAHHILRNPEKLLLNQPDPATKAICFGVLFASPPTYKELVAANQNKAPHSKLARPFRFTINQTLP